MAGCREYVRYRPNPSRAEVPSKQGSPCLASTDSPDFVVPACPEIERERVPRFQTILDQAGRNPGADTRVAVGCSQGGIGRDRVDLGLGLRAGLDGNRR